MFGSMRGIFNFGGTFVARSSRHDFCWPWCLFPLVCLQKQLYKVKINGLLNNDTSTGYRETTQELPFNASGAAIFVMALWVDETERVPFIWTLLMKYVRTYIQGTLFDFRAFIRPAALCSLCFCTPKVVESLYCSFYTVKSFSWVNRTRCYRDETNFITHTVYRNDYRSVSTFIFIALSIHITEPFYRTFCLWINSIS